jgi:transposase, IS5 family
LMIVKQRTGWGYETLVREVSDSLHLRRFCLIAIDQRVPEESTVRKLARRLGAEVVAQITRIVIAKAQRETRFRARAARIDSTVVEADIRYPSDAMLALQGVRVLAREGKKLTAMIKGKTRVTDRSRSVGRTVRAITRTLARRTGESKAQVMKLNEHAGRLIARSVREAQGLITAARASARGRGAQAKLRAARKLEQFTARCQRVTEQIDRRARGLKIIERLVSLADPDARPIRKGKLGKPTEFGYVAQICEVTENTRKGARGFVLPAGHAPGNPAENRLLPQTARELEHAGITLREIVCDGGFQAGPTKDAFPDLTDEQIQLSGHHEPGSRRTRKRRARYRTGIEGRISHLKRGYGLRRTRLKGDDGMRTWTGWAILAYDLDTLAIRAR